MANLYSSHKCCVLAAHRESLETNLEGVDVGKLAVELFKYKVITKDTKENFAFLDPDHVDADIKVRYLLQQVYQRVREDEKVYDRLVRVLSKLEGVRGVCEAMKMVLDKIERDNTDKVRVSGNNITEEDVPYLTDVLVTGSYKWEEIGIALKLPKYKRVSCGRADSDVVKLNNILIAWVSDSCRENMPATVESLRTVLASQTVGLGKLAQKVGNMDMSKDYLPVTKRQATISSVPDIEYQSYDTVVSEGKSTLLEVQVSCNGCESYQWSKDGQPLLDGADFSGVSTNILYINRASQDTEGKYSCTVSNGRETVCSDEIKLRILKLSLEKVDLVKLSDCFVNYNIISKYIYEKFSSLDQNYLNQDLRFRYLLKQVVESVREDIKLYDRLDTVLSELDGILKDLVEIIKSRIDKNIHRPVMKYSSQGDGQCCSTGDDQLRQEDCPHLVQLLLCGGDKWELIGKALTLPEEIIVRGKELQNNCSRLFHILTAWISGNYGNAKPTTFNVLREVLSDELVKALTTAKGGLQLSKILPEIECQSYDTEVSEGKSTLLVVQVSCNGCESYQWSKNGQPLLDGADYSGVSSNILYINRASQGTEGKYSCTVSNGRETECFDPINVKVLYSPEKKHLLELYTLMERKVPKDSWPPVGKFTFINLVLIKQSPISKCDYYTVRGDMDDILGSKEKVTYKKVFCEYREGALVLVEGRPGSGKTTLVHKVTRDWVKGVTLRGAKMVFLITLRILNFSGRDESLSDLLETFYDSEELKRSVEFHLKECGGKGVCFILDGLDEYQHRNKAESVIYQLIHKKCFRFSYVIVASRPVATEDLKKCCAKRIEVVGFTKSQIYKYIETYPFTSSEVGVSDMVSSLKTYLHQHPNVLHMCYLPVHAAMICFLFSELGDNIPHTETQIYEQFTIATLLRQRTCSGETKRLKSLKDLCGKEKEDFQKICELAYRMTSNSEQVVSESDVSMSLSDVTSSVVGLLTVEQASRYYGIDHLYTFHHLTFQEYLAAVHIAGLEEEKQRKITIKYNARDSKLKNVKKFYCGLLGAEKSLLLEDKVFLKNLLVEYEVYMYSTYIIQCAFESQHVELCNYALKEDSIRFSNIVLTASDFAALEYVISTASQSICKLELHSCSWDYDGVMSLSSTHTKRFQRVKSLAVYEMSGSDWSEALNSLLLQLPHLEELDLGQYFSTSNVGCFIKNVQLLNLTVLKIRLPMTPPSSHPEETLKLLTFGSHNIQSVYVNVNMVDMNFTLWKKKLCYAFGFQVFVESDISWVWLYNSDTFSSLCPERFFYCTDIVLVNCGIGDEGAELLASKLNTSVLENIVLDFNRICDSGAVALAGCMSRCSVLQEVCMECNSIGDSGATALASALVDCSSLRRLDLQGNAISDEGAVALAKAAEDKPHLRLYLHNVNITEEGVEKVLELRARTKIRSMEFSSSWEAISQAGIDDLRRALTCGSLPALKLSDTNISIIKILVEELQQVRNVKSIEYEDDVIDDTLPTLCDIIRSVNSLEHLQCELDDDSINSAQLLSDTLRSCKYLHCLSLGHIFASVIVDMVKCRSNIQSLDLSSCSLGLDDVTQLFSNHKCWFNLHTLNLSYNDIDSDGVQVLSKVLVHCNNLCYLDLSYNDIDDRGCSYLAEGLQRHTSLLGLRLGEYGSKITSDGVAALIPVIRNNHLQELDLAWCKLGSEGVAALVEVICTDTLQTLKISDVGMGLEGVVALSAGFKKCRQLEELDISDNNIGSQGISSLTKGLMNCGKLVTLDISSNNIGSHGMSSLADGLQYCTNLQVLNLNNNILTSNGVAAIVSIMKTCKYLKELYLRDNSISVDDVADLVVSWQHKNMLTLRWYPDDPHYSALRRGQRCCSRCDHLLNIHSNNDYIIISDIPKLIPSC